MIIEHEGTTYRFTYEDGIDEPDLRVCILNSAEVTFETTDEDGELEFMAGNGYALCELRDVTTGLLYRIGSDEWGERFVAGETIELDGFAEEE